MERLIKKHSHCIDAMQTEFEYLKSDYNKYLNERAILQNEKQSIKRQLDDFEKRKNNELHKQQQLLEKDSDEQKEKTQLELEQKQVEDEVLDKKNEVEQLRASLESERTNYDTMQQKLYEGNEQIARINSRKEMLEEMKDSFQGFFYGVKEILQASKKNQLQHIHGAVLDLIEVPTDYSTAIDTVLGAQSQYVVVPNDEVARQTIQWLKQENKGRATFLPLQSIEARMIPKTMIQEIELDEGFVGVASELVQTDDAFQVVANHLLGNVIVTENLHSANHIARKTRRRFRIVTLEGDMVYPGGSMSGGTKRKNNQSLFTREKELQLLVDKIDTFTTRANSFTKMVTDKKVTIDQLDKDLHEMEQQFQTTQRELQELKESYNIFMMQWKTKQDELTTYQMTLTQLVEEMDRLTNQKDDLATKRNKIAGTIKETETKIEQLTNEIQQMQKEERKSKRQNSSDVAI